jgi:signal transduction histidine kinase/PAS domain-containing protein/CheY-like chemotaxis protein
MNGGSNNEPGLHDRLRLVVVDSPDVAAPLIGALEVADIGAWMWVEAERALYFSPQVLDLLGLPYEPQEEVLTRFFHGIHPDDQEPVRGLLLGARPGGRFRIRYRFTPANGPLRWIEDRGRVERDADGRLIRQGGALRDVTQEVGRELERREADARLEALVNAMPFAVWGRSGGQLTVTHQNEASIAAWGDMRGQALSDAPANVRPIWEQQLAEAMSGQVVRVRREHPFDGNVRTIDEIVAPVIVEDRVTGAVGIAIDVTEEARAARFQALLTEISADFAGRSTDTLDAGLGVALEKIAGFLGATLAVLCDMGRDAASRQMRITHWWVDPASGHDRPRLLEYDTRHVGAVFERLSANQPVIVRSLADLPLGSAERAWVAEQRVQSFAIVPTTQLDGSRTLLGLAGGDAPVDWPADIVPCMRLAATLLSAVVARARAETNQKAIERRIQDAAKLESLGVLAGGIAHDFNNLLTAILGNASLLRTEIPSDESAMESIDQIEAASRRAAELCRQMLAYAGRGRFALQLIDVNALLRDMQAPLQVTLPRTAKLELSLTPSLPAVLADEAQLRQLVMNLVLNAAEALDAGTGTITLRTVVTPRSSDELSRTVFSPQLPDGDYVSLIVADTGHGMTPETAARIFDPFFSTRFIGRGLGLSAVVGIVRAHRGALRVESVAGAGSTFELWLPAQADRPAPSAESLSPANDAALVSWRTSGTALVIDDERGVRDLVRAVLERSGMTVIDADTGERGMEMFERIGQHVRIVLVDLAMPGLDGRDTLAAIVKNRPDVAAILMSGYSPGNSGDSAPYDFLQKPFTPAMLRSVVKRLLGE